VHSESKNCENVIGNGICSKRYNYNLNSGDYYHNINADYGPDENRQSVNKNNYKAFTVLANDNIACCAEEGVVPTNGRICCEGKPKDGADGACGCPTNFEWDSDLMSCKPIFTRCGYVHNENVCTSLIYILTHPLECLFPQREEPPYEQACCPYINYNNDEYYQPKDVEVY